MMGSNNSVVSVDRNARFNGGVSLMVNNSRNRVGGYSKDKVEAFKRKSLLILGRAIDAYIRFDDAVNDAMDNFADKLIDGYEAFGEKMKERKSEVSVPDVSVYDKLQPMMSEEEIKALGINIDNTDDITELQEFRKELMMGNFPQTEKNSGPVRRRVPNRGNNSRGSFNILTTVLIGSLFLGLLVILTFMYY